jgi:hypothetical protein
LRLDRPERPARRFDGTDPNPAPDRRPGSRREHPVPVRDDRRQRRAIGKPELAVNVAFYDLAKSATSPAGKYDATFIWAIPDVKGIYAVNATFGEAGNWTAEFTSTAGGMTEKTPVTFEVSATSSTPVVGAKAPDTVTPTLADVGGNIRAISTDTTPDPTFYKISVHDALAQHKL